MKERRDIGRPPEEKSASDRAGRRRAEKKTPRLVTPAIRESEELIRLNKFLAEAGVASRRAADQLIAEGAVKVNGRIVRELGVKVRPGKDTVALRNKPLFIEAKLVYILLNKPKDCITTASDERGRHTVLELLPPAPRVFPVGRLDRNTTGALLLTNDGQLAHRLMHPSFGALKTYDAQIEPGLKRTDLAKLTGGMALGDEEDASPCEAAILNPPENTRVLIRLHEGKNRQVRRMFEKLGYGVRRLDRVEYAGLSTEGIRRGEWRYLHEAEVRRLKKLVS